MHVYVNILLCEYKNKTLRESLRKWLGDYNFLLGTYTKYITIQRIIRKKRMKTEKGNNSYVNKTNTNSIFLRLFTFKFI